MEDVQEQREYKEGGITGKGFRKGQSGNPGGRPKDVSITAEMNKLLGADPAKIAQAKPKTGAALKARQLFASDEPTILKEIWNRADGKVPDKTELTGKDGNPIELSVNDRRQSIVDKVNRLAARRETAGTDSKPAAG